jgi:hypothetical protein
MTDRVNIKREAKDFEFWVKVVEDYIKDNTYARPEIIWSSNGVGSFRVEIIKNDSSIYISPKDYLFKFCNEHKIRLMFQIIDNHNYKVILRK